MLAYGVPCREQEIHWNYADPKHQFVLYRWFMEEATGLAGELVHERNREVDNQVLYNECWLLSITVLCNADVCMRSFDDAVAANRETFGDERPDPFPGGVIVSAPTVVHDKEGDWNFVDMPSGLPTGREQRRVVLSNVQGLINFAGCPAVDDGTKCIAPRQMGLG